MKINKMHSQMQLMCAAVLSLAFLSGCALWENKKEQTVSVVNVLSRDLYDDCHIPGSIHVDFMNIMDASKAWSKNTKIVVYCANYSCSASASAVRNLNEEGFNAVEYAAGMAGWFQAGYPVVGPAQASYLHKANEPHAESAEDLPVISTEELKNLLDMQAVDKK